MSERSQAVMIWWAIALTAVYGIVLGFLFKFIPPPTAEWGPERIAQFYSDNSTQIRIGALIDSWAAAFLLPLFVVICVQMARLEKSKAWTALCFAGGIMMSIFLVLPPLFFGVAAYTPERAPEITATMHELGMLTLVTTDQYFIFAWVAIVVISLTPTTVAHSPFPRWYGYFTAWIALMFEAGAIAFMPRTGPFAWDGLLVFWSPLSLFGFWIGVTSYLILSKLKFQRLDHEASSLETSATS